MKGDAQQPAGQQSPLIFSASWGLLGAIASYVAWRNWQFIDAGMLDPDFGVIHQAYTFNLVTLAWVFAAIAGLFALCALIPAWRRGARIALVGYTVLAGGVVGLRYYVTVVEPQRLVIRQVTLRTEKLTQPVRILHFSDLQAGSIGDYEAKVFARIRALKPDLIINTGDYLQVVPPATFDGEIEKLLALFRELSPRFGVYGVFGDTDWTGLPRLSPAQLSPLQLLSSRHVRIHTPGGVLSLCGLSLYQSKEPESNVRTVERWLEATLPDDFRILLGHSPNFAHAAGDLPVDLCLAGHTHGGQVKLPFYGPLVIDSDVPKEWASGFRAIGRGHLNVSAGAGCNRFEGLPPLRFNCPTEMTLIELVPAAAP